MGKQKCPDCPKCLPGWLAQFADLMSLLLVFFILLLSMSTMDAKKVSEAIGSLSGAMSVLEGGTMTEISKQRIQLATPIVKEQETDEIVNRVTVTISEFNEIIREHGGEDAVSVEEAEQGFIIRLPAGLLFRPGSAAIHNSDALLFLKRIAMMIKEMPNDLNLIVKGHTDDQDVPSGSMFKDNWELSSARAVTVTKVLIDRNVNPKRITAAGNAEFRPIASNATEKGRAQNRRVEIQFIGQEKSSKNSTKSSVLDNGS